MSTTMSPLHVNGMSPPAASVLDDITAQLMTISPQMAADLLRNRPANRPISKQRVRLMIEDLRAGRWAINGESIVLDSELRLLDGQHRLQACMESGVNLVSLVAIGVPQSAMPTIDSGRSKGAADVLYMSQTPHAAQLASTARWLWRYQNQRMRHSAVLLRNDALPGFIAAHPGLSSSLEWGKSLKGLLPQSPAAMLFFLMAQKDAALARRVFHGLATGLDVTSADFVYQLRERS